MAWKETYKTAKGEKRYRVADRDANGKKKSKTFLRSKDADTYVLELNRQAQLGHLWQDTPQTFGEFAGIAVNEKDYVRLTGDGWFARYALTVRDSTFDRRKDGIKHLRELLPVRLDKLSPALVEDIVLSLQGQHPRTARLAHDTIRMIVRAASVRGQAVNPQLLTLKAPSYKPSRKRLGLTGEEIERLAQASTEPHLIRVAAYTGLRQGELFALRDEDIDLEAGDIRVHATIYRGRRVERTKTEASERVVHVPPLVVSELRRQLMRRKGSAAIFPAPLGGLWFTSEFAPKFKTWALAAHLDITFHDLRHTYASLMVRAGTHPKVLQEAMGHKTMNMTMNVYTHLQDSQLKEAAENLGKLLAEGAL